MTSSLTIPTVSTPSVPARRRILIAGAAVAAAVAAFGVAETVRDSDSAPRTEVATDVAGNPLVIEPMHPSEAAFLAGGVSSAATPLVIEPMHPSEAAFIAGVGAGAATLAIESMHPAEAAFLAGSSGIVTQRSDDAATTAPSCVPGTPC